ncbi:MAG TPA: response regulator [Mucilaginibacter sp.]|jgi:DNA-binding response OmpR family regulator
MNKRILVLEDNKQSLDLIEEILAGEGYHVISFNHYESVDDINDFGPQLILLDIRLSDGYGHLLCEDLKADPRTHLIPVILISGADNLEKIARECQADDFLPKPFDMNDLLQKVKLHLVDTNIAPQF